MIEAITLGLILALLVLMGTHELEKRVWQKERSQLLSRIMAKTLPEYVEAEAKMQPIQVITVEDLKREIAPPREEGLEVG